MQEVVSWFVVVSFMILFFGISMNIYNAFFSDVVLVSDDIHIVDSIEHGKLNKKNRVEEKQNIKKDTYNSQKMNSLKYKEEIKLKRRTNISKKDNSNSSKTYTRKYTSYKEFKKYNSVSR